MPRDTGQIHNETHHPTLNDAYPTPSVSWSSRAGLFSTISRGRTHGRISDREQKPVRQGRKRSPEKIQKRLTEHTQFHDDGDRLNMEKLALGYSHVREQIWKKLANRVGEKWQIVEAKALSTF